MALPFVVAEEERLVFPDGPAQGGTKLVLAEFVEARSHQRAGSVQNIVAEILVEGAVQAVGPALGDDVHDAAYRPSELRAVAAVDPPAFFCPVRRRLRFLTAGSRGHFVRAVARPKIVVNVLSGERQ